MDIMVQSERNVCLAHIKEHLWNLFKKLKLYSKKNVKKTICSYNERRPNYKYLNLIRNKYCN